MSHEPISDGFPFISLFYFYFTILFLIYFIITLDYMLAWYVTAFQEML